jgi:hypothetical protein
MALCTAAQEAIYLRALLKDLNYEQEGETIIHQDNQGCMAMANNSMTSTRAKHIDIKYHFVRERIENREIKLQYLASEKMMADMLTKPVSKQIIDRSKVKLFGKP